jgi:asparagine synthase (glutamine-hydrolysing)
MSGFVGIAQSGCYDIASRMLQKIAYRGHTTEIIETALATLGIARTKGVAGTKPQPTAAPVSSDRTYDHFVFEQGDSLILKRDPLGVVPLYFGWTQDGILCFASEVKGLIEITQNIYELPPGHTFDGQNLKAYFRLRKLPMLKDSPQKIAKELHRRLSTAVEKHARFGSSGAWLSGGLDSSIMASLARPYMHPFHTFAAGLPGSADIKYARIVANFIKSEHHEVIVKITDLLKILPEVIYHLESFDAWLVRSSIMNYLVAQQAAQYVPSVFSGEGGDELFAGYEYLKSFDASQLGDELIDITSRLHNTALQRVDRCSAAHGTIAYVGFLELDVVDYALRIPPKYKMHNGVEKWILRQSMIGELPETVLYRPKAKFWQGAGVGDLLAGYAEKEISDADYACERQLPNGWWLNSKEELLYYRIFREQVGQFSDMDWMGRTKGMPLN